MLSIIVQRGVGVNVYTKIIPITHITFCDHAYVSATCPGTPTLTVNGVLLSQHNATLLLVDIVSAGHSSGYMHLACHSAVATPAYTWYYCYGGSEQRMMSTASARLSLPVDSAQTGVYTCVVPRDGFVSVSIYHEGMCLDNGLPVEQQSCSCMHWTHALGLKLQS